jgi:hypothetical protein
MVAFASYADERAEGFVGREWLFERVAAWLGADDARVLLILGEPGSGKSAVAARLDQISRGVYRAPSPALTDGFLTASHFCYARDTVWRSPRGFAWSLATQLAARYPEFRAALLQNVGELNVHVSASIDVGRNEGTVIGFNLANLSVGDLAKPSALFVRLVRQPLDALFAARPGESVTVLVDALDEAEFVEDESIASLIGSCAYADTGLRFIVTSRPLSRTVRLLTDVTSQSSTISLSEGATRSLSKGDVASYVEARLDNLSAGRKAAISTAVAQRAGVNFLYARYALPMVRECGEDDVDTFLAGLPPGLDEIYLRFLERLPRVEERWGPAFRPVLGMLAVAREPLSVQQLARFTALTEHDVRDHVSTLSELLAHGPDKRTYRLYHESFVDLLLSDRAGRFECSASELHAGIVQWYAGRGSSAGRDWARADDYGLRHVVTHLARADERYRAPAAHIVTRSYAENVIRRFGSEASLVDDARTCLERAVADGDTTEALRWLTAFWGFRERVSELGGDLLGLLVKAGRAAQARTILATLELEHGVDGTSLKARAELAAGLAATGAFDEACRLISAYTDRNSRRGAIRLFAPVLARYRPDLAAALCAEHSVVPNSPEMFALLARDPRLLDTACDLARGEGAYLEAMAAEVARYDIGRALRLSDDVRSYDERFDYRWTPPGRDSIRAASAIAIAETDPYRALNILRDIADDHDRKKLLMALAGPLAERDAGEAISILRVFSESSIARGLACAVALARVPHEDPGTRVCLSQMAREVIERMDELLNAGSGFLVTMGADTDIPVLRTFPFEVVQRDDDARSTARDIVARLARAALIGLPRVRRPASAAAIVAGLVAAFSVDEAEGFATEVYRVTNSASELNAARFGIFEMILRQNPDAAVRFAVEKQDNMMFVTAAGVLAREDPARAFGVLGSIAPRYSGTRMAVLRAIADHVGANDETMIGRLMKAVPRYTDSEKIQLPALEAVGMACAAMARRDVVRAETELRRRDLARIGLGADERCGAAFAQALTASDQAGAYRIACALRDGEPKAYALAVIAESSPDEEIRAAAADGALRVLRAEGRQSFGAWSRLAVATCVDQIWISSAALDKLPDDDLTDAVNAIIARASAADLLVPTMRLLLAGATNMSVIYVLLLALDETGLFTDCERGLALFGIESSRIADSVRAVHELDRDPEAALARWRALGREHRRWFSFVHILGRHALHLSDSWIQFAADDADTIIVQALIDRRLTEQVCRLAGRDLGIACADLSVAARAPRETGSGTDLIRITAERLAADGCVQEALAVLELLEDGDLRASGIAEVVRAVPVGPRLADILRAVAELARASLEPSAIGVVTDALAKRAATATVDDRALAAIALALARQPPPRNWFTYPRFVTAMCRDREPDGCAAAIEAIDGALEFLSC